MSAKAQEIERLPVVAATAAHAIAEYLLRGDPSDPRQEAVAQENRAVLCRITARFGLFMDEGPLYCAPIITYRRLGAGADADWSDPVCCRLCGSHALEAECAWVVETADGCSLWKSSGSLKFIADDSGRHRRVHPRCCLDLMGEAFMWSLEALKELEDSCEGEGAESFKELEDSEPPQSL